MSSSTMKTSWRKMLMITVTKKTSLLWKLWNRRARKLVLKEIVILMKIYQLIMIIVPVRPLTRVPTLMSNVVMITENLTDDEEDFSLLGGCIVALIQKICDIFLYFFKRPLPCSYLLVDIPKPKKHQTDVYCIMYKKAFSTLISHCFCFFLWKCFLYGFSFC